MGHFCPAPSDSESPLICRAFRRIVPGSSGAALESAANAARISLSEWSLGRYFQPTRICHNGHSPSLFCWSTLLERARVAFFCVPTLGFHEPARAVVALGHSRNCSGTIGVASLSISLKKRRYEIDWQDDKALSCGKKLLTGTRVKESVPWKTTIRF